ncbi:uncharacterized protein LOC121778484 [Salvia splendens]|uniref:uncharacterized protein LOC121778484 n=1 Tax=Salvia splendens TaxID=180675 RepID=UPI001C25D8E2|nr:uncharacterized protein LOC121778484 [Salvia splendens]
MADDKPTTESSSSKIRSSKNVTVAFKLNGGNYPLWSRLMKVAIGSRGGYSHITGKPAPPAPDSKEYEDWEETDLIVFSWIVDNIENNIIADFAHHQSAQALWESLATTYESEADLYLVYDLEDKANTIKQGDMDLETYYRKIHGMWINIDRCQKQPIDCCDKGVSQFRAYSNTKRVLRFLAGLNEEYEGVRRDILKEVTPPPIEAAYSLVKKEAARRRIGPPMSLNNTTDNSHGGTDLASGGIGHGLAAQGQRQPHRAGNSRPTATTHRPGSKPVDKSKLWCSHCGMQKHTRENCFQLVGYPDWWEEKQTGRAKMAVGLTIGNETRKSNSEKWEAPPNGRGKQKEGRPEASSGGGGGGVVGAGNFAERRNWNERGNGASSNRGYSDEEDTWAWH